ncbi:hypothetical protein [Bradyrhizobium sp. CB3481]|nr:hypothetical protein [Bradyrhizobium sp. CB3481]WFU14497.1 hypothetical protein QA643_25395 [Bradyrhizobium sp. CB3481]
MMDEMMNVRAVVEMSQDADLLREMIGFAAPWLMEIGPMFKDHLLWH